MALMHVDFFSNALGMCTQMDVILPQQTRGQIGMEGKAGDRFPTLFLLHGMSDDHTIWQRRTSIERYVADLNLAVVMPTTHLAWYSDTQYGYRYWEYISHELPEICRSFFRGMSDRREDTFAAGLSMAATAPSNWDSVPATPSRRLRPFPVVGHCGHHKCRTPCREPASLAGHLRGSGFCSRQRQ